MKRTFTLFLILSCPATLVAQWQELPGPSAGQINDFCEISGSNGGEIYAASINGVYRTMDHAQSWQLMGLQGNYVVSVTQYVSSAAEILLTTVKEPGLQWNVCRSEDSGKTWDTVFSFKSNSGNMHIVQDGNDVVMALSGTASDTAAGIYRSVDIGRNWVHQALAPSANGPLTDFTVGGGSIFAIAGDTVWSMPSHGSTWSATTYPYWHHPKAIKFFGNNLFVGAAGRMDISTNDGLAWLNAPNSDLDTTVDSISTFAVNGTNIVAAGLYGVYYSSDGAISWQHIEGTGGYPRISTGDMTFIDGRFFSGTGAGVVASADGIAWAYQADGLIGGVEQLASDGSTLFATTLRGIFRSTDRGETWIDPVGPRDLVDSLAQNLEELRGHVYASGGNGDPLWQWDSSKWNSLNELVGIPLTADSAAFFAVSDVIVRSLDSGRTWTPADTGIDEPMISVVAGTGTIFAISIQGNVYSSSNEGSSWQLLSAHHDLGSGGSIAFVAGKIYITDPSKLQVFTPDNRSWDSVDIVRPWELWPFASSVVAQNQDGLYLVNGMAVSPLLDSLGSGFYFGFASDDSLIYVADGSGYIHTEPITSLPLVVGDESSAPASIGLSIFPNPTNGLTTISFTLPRRQRISLKLYDDRGVNVGTYINGSAGPGNVQVPIDVMGLASGSYVAMLSTPDGTGSVTIVRLPK